MQQSIMSKSPWCKSYRDKVWKVTSDGQKVKYVVYWRVRWPEVWAPWGRLPRRRPGRGRRCPGPSPRHTTCGAGTSYRDTSSSRNVSQCTWQWWSLSSPAWWEMWGGSRSATAASFVVLQWMCVIVHQHWGLYNCVVVIWMCIFYDSVKKNFPIKCIFFCLRKSPVLLNKENVSSRCRKESDCKTFLHVVSVIQVRRESREGSVGERSLRGDLHVTGWVGFHHIFST